MKLEIEIISTEVITPSSPTPPHLKNYKLSFLDQLMPPVLASPLLFYATNYNDNQIIKYSERSSHLKNSLSKALSLFYPLAGRLVGNSYVNCNDEGVTYVEARANGNLVDVVTNRNPEQLIKFVPCDTDGRRDICLVVQATFFSCGGLAIGLGISHKLADGFSTAMFFNSWAAFSRGGGGDHLIIPSPIFESPILFPPQDLVSEDALIVKHNENLVTKLFTFSSRKIDVLRDRYSKINAKDTEGFIRPTRIETLSSFIMTRFMVAASTTGAKVEHKRHHVHALQIAVDIRTRVVPPLSEYHFGNILVPLTILILPSLEKDDEDAAAYGIVKKTRDAIRNVNEDILSALKNGLEEADKSEAVVCRFTSVCNFPLHKADFGWGIPVWIGVGSLRAKNMVLFTNSLSEGGIDALVTMAEEDMAKFEADNELLKYVSHRDETKFLSKL